MSWRIALRDGELRLDDASLLLDADLRADAVPEGWRVETGTWTAMPSGLEGRIEGDRAAVLWCAGRYPCDHAVEVTAEPLPGHTNDANAFFRAAGSIYGPGDTGAWIAGNAGWYVHDDGLEKHPDGPTWRVPGLPLAAGQPLRFVAGVRRGRVFLFKDASVVLERADPAPLDPARHDRVGLGTWDSAIRFLRVRVWEIPS